MIEIITKKDFLVFFAENLGWTKGGQYIMLMIISCLVVIHFLWSAICLANYFIELY